MQMGGCLLIAALTAAAVYGEDAKAPANYAQDFDAVAAGGLPGGWKIAATGPRGELAEWKVAADAGAPSKPNVLTIAAIHDTSTGVFNLCWTSRVKFKDGAISVKARANTGKTDQGGGPMWRVRDAGNYYVCRYNPLERNFRLYVVRDGLRKQLADAKDIGVRTGEWFTISVSHRGERIECSLNGKKYLEATDPIFPDAGGVGLWTKADAATSFDDFSLTPE